MLTLTDILTAQRTIRPYIRHTPLLHSPFLSDLSGGDVWLKLENWQPTGSFKIRGALHKIHSLSADEKARGLVTASAGNHALGVAYAAQSLGDIPSDIFVPTTAPRAKLDKLRRFPVQVHQVGGTYDAAHAAAEDFRVANNAVEISAYDDWGVMAGQGTMALEILADQPQTDVLLVPIGGGGVVGGVQTAVAAMRPDCAVVGVQPKASPAALLSLQDGRPHETYDHAATIADGLAGGFGALPFAVIRPYAPQIALASETDMRRAIFTLLDQHQLVVEPSGAIAIAPLLTGSIDVRGKTVACILTGGNLDTGLLRQILDEFG